MYSMLICAIDELWLKGKNRPIYMRAVLKHIDKILKKYHGRSYSVKNVSQRLTYSSEYGFSEETLHAMLKVPGLAGIYPSVESELNLDSLKTVIHKEMQAELLKFPESEIVTFKVICKRINRKFNTPSMEVEREIGGFLLENFKKLKVDVRTPQIKVDVRIVETRILSSLKFHRGIGGLPIGTSGHGITLLSGGFDSPVASFLMAKRGLRQTFVFFHAYPYVGDEVLEKIKSLASLLSKYQKLSHLYIVPFGEIQKLISEKAKEEYRTILFRQEMLKISELLALQVKGDCLIVGDALGQVSSQTIANMSLMDKAVDMMIMRPLIGFNKLEVLKLATEIKTHDISIIPHDDACALFAPENPIINANKNYWDEFNSQTDWSEIRHKALKKSKSYFLTINGELIEEENRLFL